MKFLDYMRRVPVIAFCMALVLLTLLSVIVVISATGPVLAQAATTADNQISALPWYKWIEPYIQLAVGAVVSVVLPIIAALVYKWFGIKLTDSDRIALQTAATNAAGRILANVEGPVSGLKFTPNDSRVAAEAQRVQVIMKDEVDRLGLSPDRVAGIIAGKLGQLQTGGPVSPVDPAAKGAA